MTWKQYGVAEEMAIAYVQNGDVTFRCYAGNVLFIFMKPRPWLINQ